MVDFFIRSRKVNASVQGPRHGFFTNNQDDQLLTTQVATNMEQEPLGGSRVIFQHDFSPTTVVGDQDVETAFNQQVRLTDQEQYERECDRKRIYSLEAKLATETDRSAWLQATVLNMEQVLHEKEAEIRELSAATQRQNSEIKQTRAELHHVKTKYQQTSQLLHERSEELSTAQQFLGKADSISSTEVVRLVETLNAEIAQQSNFILDSLTYRKWTGSANDLEHMLKGLRHFIGPWLYDNLWHRLNEPDSEFDHLLTQLALQTGLTNACKSIINNWDPPFRDAGKILDRIHGNMGRKVGQVVVGKWRALSSTYLGVDFKANKQHLTKVILKLIAAVGGPLPHQSGDSFPPDLRGIVDDITRKALEIHQHVRASVTSMDLEVYSVPCGTQFNAFQMEDSDGPDRSRGKAENDNLNGKVICTLEMGLRYKKKVSSDKQGEFKDETGVILKSKVVLVGALADYGILSCDKDT